MAVTKLLGRKAYLVNDAGQVRPVTLSTPRKKQCGYRWAEQTGADLAFEGAYDDHALIAAQGKSQQTMTKQGRNLNPYPVEQVGYSSIGNLVIGVPYAGLRYKITVMAEATYVVSKIGMIGATPYYAEFDANNVFISRSLALGNILTIGSNTKYVGIYYYALAGIPLNGEEKIQLELGSIATPYSPFVPDSPSPGYPSPIYAANGDLVVCNADGSKSVTLPLPELRGIPDGAGGCIARDTLEVVGGRLKLTRGVDPAIDAHTTASIVGASQYVLSPPIITDLGPIDLPTHYPFARILTVPNDKTHGDLLPEVTARVRVVDV